MDWQCRRKVLLASGRGNICLNADRDDTIDLPILYIRLGSVPISLSKVCLIRHYQKPNLFLPVYLAWSLTSVLSVLEKTVNCTDVLLYNHNGVQMDTDGPTQ